MSNKVVAWLCRNREGRLTLFFNKPHYHEQEDKWLTFSAIWDNMEATAHWGEKFPEVTVETSPYEITIKE